MDENEAPTQIGTGYPLDQLARAFTTATQHEDAETRRRAQTRLDRWAGVVRGIASGDLSVGSRTPVAGLPGLGDAQGGPGRLRHRHGRGRRPAGGG